VEDRVKKAKAFAGHIVIEKVPENGGGEGEKLTCGTTKRGMFLFHIIHWGGGRQKKEGSQTTALGLKNTEQGKAKEMG